MVHHVTLYKLQPEVTPAKLEQLMISTRMTLLKLPEILSVKCGKNIDPKCNKQCFEEGETPVLVVDSSGEVLDIANGVKVTSLPGAHVEIKATRSAKDQTLTVLDVKKIAI